MASYANFESKNNKNANDRYDIYEPAFESPLKKSDYASSIIDRNIDEFTKLCSFLRWYPDIFWDMYKPEMGALTFDLHQRVMMRALARFGENYFCAPRGISKTLVHILIQYHTACCFPNITTSITASTKESAVKIWKDKHDEILRFYPDFASNIKSAQFSKDSGKVEFVNGSVIDNLANSQQSKGLRRRRGGLEESALIDKETYDDAIEPIFNISRTTMTGETDAEELNGQINRYSTSGYKNSDEYDQILRVARDMINLKGSFVFGSDWYIPVHFGRQKIATINKARERNVIRFRQNYLCDWVGVSDGGLVNISKLIKSQILVEPELECPKDKRGQLMLNEYIISGDISRSNNDNNNKSAFAVLKIIRDNGNRVRQVQVVNIVVPPNGLNYEEQSILVKRLFYKYGGDLDLSKSRVKAIIIDANGVGQGVVEKLLEEQTDYETNNELGAFATINTDDKCKAYAPKIVYALKAQGINTDTITTFIGFVESNRLKLLNRFDDIKADLSNDIDLPQAEQACLNTQHFIDEVANLKLKKNATSLSEEKVVSRVDRDRYSAIKYGLYYIAIFMDNDTNIDFDEDDDSIVLY